MTKYEDAFVGPDGDPHLIEADREMVTFSDVWKKGKEIVQIPQSLDFAEFTDAEWRKLWDELPTWIGMLHDATQTVRRHLPHSHLNQHWRSYERRSDEYDPSVSTLQEETSYFAEHNE